MPRFQSFHWQYLAAALLVVTWENRYIFSLVKPAFWRSKYCFFCNTRHTVINNTGYNNGITNQNYNDGGMKSDMWRNVCEWESDLSCTRVIRMKSLRMYAQNFHTLAVHVQHQNSSYNVNIPYRHEPVPYQYYQMSR
jgi:hypothetical protein